MVNLYTRIEDLILKNKTDDDCIIDESGNYSYSVLNDKINSVSNGIRKLGISRQSAFIILMPNGVDAIISIMALNNCNMIAVPIDDQTQDNTINDMIKLVDAQAVIYSDELNEKIRSGSFKVRCLNINELYCKESISDSTYKSPDDLSLILFTSGTSGHFKAVAHSHNSLIRNIESVMDYMDVSSSDRLYILKTYVHCSSLISEVFLAFFAGASVCVFKSRVSINVSLNRIEKENATIIGVNPTLLRILNSISLEKVCQKMDKVRVVVTSGFKISPSFFEECKKMFPNGKIINVYGLTEAGPRVSSQRPDGNFENGSVGIPIKNVNVKIENINEYGDIRAGEIYVDSPSLMIGYYKNDTETQKKIVDGWLRTGDLGYINDNGELFVIGRLDDMIIRSSHNVDPYRVDNVIESIPGVDQSVTFGIPDKINGENIVSSIVLDKNCTLSAADITKYCRDNLYNYEIPNYIYFTDAIPLTNNKKVSRKSLMKQFLEEH